MSYASRKLRSNELHYSTIEKEILSVVFSLAKFRPFVYGKIIRVQSDHRPLCFLNSIVKTSPRLARWALAIQDYNILWEHIKGKDQLADVFTRRD